MSLAAQLFEWPADTQDRFHFDYLSEYAAEAQLYFTNGILLI